MKLKIGMAGYGLMGRYNFAPNIKNSMYAELQGVCGRDFSKCSEFAREMNIPSCYKSYEEMLADSSIDAVIIATPNNLHFPQVCMAAEAGKHILCEKPLALNMEEAGKMVDVCGKANVVLMVGHHLRFKACNIRAADMVKAGTLGRISTARVRWSFNHTGCPPEKGWRTIKALSGGGQVMNVNSHCIDLLVYIFGTPVKVSSFINREQGTETENVSIVMVEFEKGVLATAQGSDMEETRPSNLEIFGGRGSLIVEGACSTDRTGTIQNLPGYIPEKTEFPESPYTLEIDHFARAIKEGFEPISSGRENLKTMEIVMAAYRSAETGRHICLQNR